MGGRGLRGWRGTHQTQQEGAAAAGQALQGREAPSANGGEGGSKTCGWGRSGQGENNEEARRCVRVNAWGLGGGIRCGWVPDGALRSRWCRKGVLGVVGNVEV